MTLGYTLMPGGGLCPQDNRPPHVLYLAVIALAAFLAVYFSAFSAPFDSWSDSANYLAAGMHMLQKGSFMPLSLPYEQFARHGAQGFGSLVNDYPNYGYALLQGAIGLACGGGTLLGGVWSAAVSTLCIGVAAYVFLYLLAEDAPLALLFSVGVLSHRLVLDLAATPRPDIMLLLFLLLALICTVRGHHLAAGALLGAGYLIREHALIFLPFLPLLSPQGRTIRGLFRAGTLTVLGFVPAMAVGYGIKLHFTSGQLQENFYVKNHSSWLHSLMRPEAAARVLNHMRSHLARLGPMAWVALGFLALRWRQTPPLARRMLLLAVIFSLIPCLMWVERPHVPNRYALYSVPLYLAALILCLRGHRHGAAAVVLLLLPATALFAYSTVAKNDSLRVLLSPGFAWERLESDVASPEMLRREFRPGSVMITNRPGMLLLMMDNPVLVAAPGYEEFARSPGNDGLDGILVQRNMGWPSAAEVVDGRGARFARVALPEGLDPLFLCYKRVAP